MAQMEIIRIKAMVDKEKNRVVFVESDQDFVDLLLSFLTMPMGTITRLIRDVNTKSSPAPVVGCMNNLYKSVENLDVKHFSTDHCKIMLLYPRRAAEAKCNSLKLKMDHSEPTQYNMVGGSSHLYHQVCITASGASVCSQCTKCSDNQRVVYLDESHTADAGIFVKGGNTRYIVTDDLKVKSGSVGDCLSMLGAFGIRSWSRLEERNVDVSPKEVLSLLQRSLISRTPLTDLILLKGGESSEKVTMEPRVSCTMDSKGQGKDSSTIAEVRETLMISKSTNRSLYATVKEDFVDLLFSFLTMDSMGQGTDSSTLAEVRVTLMISKSTNRSLYATVKEDFVELLFSFLALPLGSIVKFCGGASLMGCVDNLYQSVEDLSSQGQIVSEDCMATLVNPKLATHFRSMNQLLWVDEVDNNYRVVNQNIVNRRFLTNVAGSASSCKDVRAVMNPKLPGFIRSGGPGGRFISGPGTYMVTNDLVVTPLCLTTGLVFLKNKNVPISDVEERIITIGKQEAFNLLMASLLTDTALDSIIGSTYEVAYPTRPTVKKEQVNGM